MLGERLKKLRKEKKISQYEAAERLGFSRGKLANYEQGSRQPDYDTLKKLADFYDVSVSYLLGETDSEKFITNEEEFVDGVQTLTDDELLEKYKFLIDGKPATKEEKKIMLSVIRSLRSK